MTFSYNTLTESVRESFVRFPDKIAIKYIGRDGNVCIKYNQLKEYSDSVSQLILSYKSDGSFRNNYYVGVFFSLSYSFPCIIYGILKAGFTFVPLDPMNGSLWNKNIIDSLKIKLIFTNNDNGFVSEITNLVEKLNILNEALELRCTNIDSEDDIPFLPMAYSVQTSGSTGPPKIIKVPHQSIVPNIKDLSVLFQVSPDDVIFLSSTPTFDPSVIDIFLALSNGATLLIVDEFIKSDPGELLEVLFPLSSSQVTILQITPSQFQRWTRDQLSSRVFLSSSKLKILAFGGERCPSLNTIKDWNISSSVEIYNLYGISEVSCWAAATKLSLSLINTFNADNNDNEGSQYFQNNTIISHRDNNQSFTTPLSETSLLLKYLDENNIGEMFIGSNSRICFIDDEGSEVLNGSKVYRSTGDFFQKVGEKYYFIGRMKDNVKRFGVKVSLKSVEILAENDASVSRAVCLWRESRNEVGRLSLYIVPHSHLNFDVYNFKKLFKEKCPQGAWPDLVTTIPSIPVTNHGKIDEQYLINSMLGGNEPGDISELFESLWLNYTVNSEVVYDKGFMSSGGTSFSAVQLLSELQQHTNIEYDFLLNLIGDVNFTECLKILERFNLKRKIDQSSESPINDSQYSNMFLKKIRTDNDNFTSIDKYESLDSIGGNNSGKHSRSKPDLFINIKWKYYLGKCVDASPSCDVVDNLGYAVIGSHNGHVAVLNPDNGSLISKILLADRIESTACLDNMNQSFAIGCYNGLIYSYKFNGDLIWSYKTNDMIKTQPILKNSKIIFGSYDKYLYCLKSTDGKVVWKQNVFGQVLSRVEYVDSHIIVATLSGIVSAHQIEDGRISWSYKMDAPVFSNFIIHDKWCIVADVRGTLHWISSQFGRKDFEYKADGNIFCSLIKDEDSLLFGTTERWLYRLTLEEPTLIWKVQLDSRLISAPLVLNSECFTHFHMKIKSNRTEDMFKEFSVIFITSSKGCVHLVDKLNGEIIKTFNLPAEVYSSPTLYSNSILIGCRDDHVYCLEVKSM